MRAGSASHPHHAVCCHSCVAVHFSTFDSIVCVQAALPAPSTQHALIFVWLCISQLLMLMYACRQCSPPLRSMLSFLCGCAFLKMYACRQRFPPPPRSMFGIVWVCVSQLLHLIACLQAALPSATAQHVWHRVGGHQQAARLWRLQRPHLQVTLRVIQQDDTGVMRQAACPHCLQSAFVTAGCGWHRFSAHMLLRCRVPAGLAAVLLPQHIMQHVWQHV
jgi:hypothetical protein